eukprot:4882535-Pyramimonas_sp.AAC.1
MWGAPETEPLRSQMIAPTQPFGNTQEDVFLPGPPQTITEQTSNAQESTGLTQVFRGPHAKAKTGARASEGGSGDTPPHKSNMLPSLKEL